MQLSILEAFSISLLLVWPPSVLITNSTMLPSLTLAQGKGRVGNGVSFWLCLWFPHSRPFLLPTHPVPESHGWLIMEQSCCPLICACASHVLLEALPQLWWIIWDRVTGAHGHSAPWLCQCQCWIQRLPRESWEGDFAETSPPSPRSLKKSSLHGFPCLRLFAPNWVAHSVAGPRGHLRVTFND